MNNTFDLKRFGLLLKRQWLELGKIYLISLLVVIGVNVAFYVANLYPFTSISSRDLNFREPLFIFFGLLFITIISGSYFANLGQKSRAIIDLMLPASTFEKFLAGILFTGILSTASFILIFYLTDLAFVSHMRSVFDSEVLKGTFATVDDKELLSIDKHLAYFFVDNKAYLLKPVFVAPFFATSMFLLGSVYFNKFHYIKTAISLMIFCGIWTAIMAKSGKLLYDNKNRVHELPLINGKADAELLLTLLLILLTAIFWAVTYTRLKEKEV